MIDFIRVKYNSRGVFMIDRALIGGTGIKNLYDKKIEVDTKYGKVKMGIIEKKGRGIAFLSRHGEEHSVPPHSINYRANIAALKELGVKYVLATAAVGSCNESFIPGSVLLMKDFLDFTKGRDCTFFDGADGVVAHVDMSKPYCENLRKVIISRFSGKRIHLDEGVYVCTEGPRFESASEIKFYRSIGGDVVGMTGIPELVLAREMGMCYASVGIVSNWCTGFNEFSHTKEELDKNLSKLNETVISVLKDVLEKEELNQDKCKCSDSLLFI